MIDLLIRRATVLTMDRARTVIEDGAVAVDGGRIVAVGLSPEVEKSYSAVRVIDAQRKVVMPGLVDAHGHGGHSLLKTIAADTPSLWGQVVTQVYFHSTTDEYWYIEGLLSALERLKFGVTCGLSVIGSQPRSDDPVFASNHARAYAEVGIREVVAVGPANPPWPRRFSRWEGSRPVEREVTFGEAMEAAEAVIEAWDHGANDRIRVFVTPFLIVPSLDSSGPTPPDIARGLQPHDREQSRRVREVAQKHATRIHSDAFGGMVLLAAQDEYGLLGADVSLQHCNGLSPAEIDILAATDTRVGHAPGRTQARARCPVPELINAGVTVAVTSDGTSPCTSFDLFQSMRKAQLIHQLALRDLFYLPAGKLLEMVTIDAARALGWDDELGSLEVGKKADIILIDMQQPHLAPRFMPVHRMVHQAVGNDVDTVIVDGKVIMENRKVLTVDEPGILEAAQAEALATVARAGLQQHMEVPEAFWGQARLHW